LNTIAGVLVGGVSRRMGRPKALLRREGRTLSERTVAVARDAIGEIVLLGRPPFELPASLTNADVIEDLYPGMGPPGALATFFSVRPNNALVLIACDLPLLTADLLRRLQPEPGVDAVVFATRAPPGGWEPCCGLYLPSAAPTARQAIERAAALGAGVSMKHLLQQLRVHTIALDPTDAALLRNLNTPEDAAELEWN